MKIIIAISRSAIRIAYHTFGITQKNNDVIRQDTLDLLQTQRFSCFGNKFGRRGCSTLR